MPSCSPTSWDHAHLDRALSGRPAPLVVTAASANHFKPLQRFLKSFEAHGTIETGARSGSGLAVPLVVYDLGLTSSQRLKVLAAAAVCTLVPLDAAAYPPHVDLLRRGSENLTYAFKPIIFKQVAEQYRGQVLWLDAGVGLIGSKHGRNGTLTELFAELRRGGVVSTFTGNASAVL
eukprot:3358117-Prymnesium_polylepis.1